MFILSAMHAWSEAHARASPCGTHRARARAGRWLYILARVGVRLVLADKVLRGSEIASRRVYSCRRVPVRAQASTVGAEEYEGHADSGCDDDE